MNVGDIREFCTAEHLNGRVTLKLGQVQCHRLHKARKVGDHQNDLVFKLAEERQNAPILGVQKLQRSAPESGVLLPQAQQPAHPPQQAVRIVLLGLYVARFVVIFGINVDGQIQLLRIRCREAGVPVARPLHRRPHAVPVPQVEVIAHADFVTVVDHRRARQ